MQLILPECGNPGARLIRGWPQPLGILSIATFLREHSPQIEIEVLDGTILSNQEIESRIEADIVGITAISRAYPNVLKVASRAKDVGAQVVLGGQYATAISSTILRNRPYVDAIIRYDGEEAMLKYVNGSRLDEIENLVFRRDDGSIQENRIRLHDINTLPIPDRSLLNLNAYDRNYIKNIGGPFKRAGTINSQRGCRWRADPIGGCIFCTIPEYTWRLREPSEVWKEIQQLEDLGVEFLYDTSDDIGADREWLRVFTDIKPNVEMYFRHYLSAQNVDNETIEALLKIGCVHVFIGFESADPMSLKRMNKTATVEDNKNAVLILNKYRLPLLASFVIGVPGETRASVKRTWKFAKYVSEQTITAGIHLDVLKPIPGSRAYQMILKHPVLGPKYSGVDLLNYEELKLDWVNEFCEVDYDFLSSFEDEAENLIPDIATYSPINHSRTS